MPWTTLVRAPRKPQRSSSSIGEQPCSAWHSSSSRRCSQAWTWRTRSWLLGVVARSPRSSRPGTARTLCTATPTPTPGRPEAHARRPSSRSRNVSTSGRRSAAARGWARDPGRRGGRRPAAARSPARADRGLGQRDRHRVGLRVGSAVGLVVHVVKLAHRAVAGRRHLRVHPLAHGAHRVGVVLAGEPVHLRPPAPEVVARMAPPAARRSPRRSSWKAWLWALAIAGTVAVLIAAVLPPRDPRAAASASRTYTGSPPSNTIATGLWPSR